ncbi:hypothetical protein [Pengzhenrongella frigida]|uniref:Uncharacterized protein n=1 Tax=Pengzhenrongella frigida TaxID=1259133 RepID=A0A4Q5MZ47_9MICO|nr:hypothetical protein [Cellulomonas sp. HLT2-17]RYV50980.1 hypothetical protein EUA98_10760 [Cellulomonas sp. HLT2-17]
MDTLKVQLGPLDIDFRGTTVNVTPHMLDALDRIRAALITVAQLRATTSYKGLAAATGGAYSVRGFGKALDAITIDCRDRNEPSLASLVVHSGGDKEVGDGFRGNAKGERDLCYAQWAL